MKEIERKWILPNIPDVSDQIPVEYERHFLFIDTKIEIRIQRKGNKFEFERKFDSNELKRIGEKFEITEEEFIQLRKNAVASLIRESFIVDGISVKVYKGKYEGLIRAEVEFESEEEAKAFQPLNWFGKEITNTDLGKDKKLVQLSELEFEELLEEYLMDKMRS